MPEYMGKDKRTFIDIVFDAIHSIGEKSLVEYRGGQKRTLLHGNWSETIIEPDSRKEAIQSIEFLYDLTYSKFRNEKNFPPAYKEYCKEIGSDSDKIMKQVGELLNKYEGDKLSLEEYTTKKLRLMKKLFRILMKGVEYSGITSVNQIQL